MSRKNTTDTKLADGKKNNKFRLEFLNSAQQIAYTVYQQHDVTFFIGPAGTGKTFLATAFAVNEILKPGSTKSKIILCRPVVESGENLGFLPGDVSEKLDPYMRPFMDCLEVLTNDPKQKEHIASVIEIAPLAFLRGRTFMNAICILDEAQNATKSQMKMFLTRFGQNSKIIVTGDPKQSDLILRGQDVPLTDVIHRLETVPGIGMVHFKNDAIVRHPLVGAILDKLED